MRPILVTCMKCPDRFACRARGECVQKYTTTEVPRDHCPNCLGPLTKATNATQGDDDPPKPGDVTICFHCAAVLTFLDNLQLTIFPELEIEKLSDGERKAIRSARTTVLAMMEGRAQQ